MLTHEEEKRMLKKRKKEFWDEEHRTRIKKRKKLIKRARERRTPEYIIDHKLNEEATKHGGFLYLSCILNTFEETLNKLNTPTEVLNNILMNKPVYHHHHYNYSPKLLFKLWTMHEVTKKGPAFIRGLDKNHPNVKAVWSAITSGFLDDKDIQNDLGLKSKRQADRILTPSSYKSLKHMNQVSKHIPAKYIVRVWHIKQGSKVSNRIYGAGRRPQKVVSVENYLQFLLNSYKDIVPKKININKYYTKFGKQLAHDWEFSSNQNRELMFLIQSSYIKYIKGLNSTRIDEFLLWDSSRQLNTLQGLYVIYMGRFTINMLRYYKQAKTLKKLGREYLDIFQYRAHSEYIRKCKALLPKISKLQNIVFLRQKQVDKELDKYLNNNKSFMDNFRKRYPINTRSKLFTKCNKVVNSIIKNTGHPINMRSKLLIKHNKIVGLVTRHKGNFH